MERLARLVTRRFPWLAALLAGLAMLFPEWFTPLGPAVVPLLGVVMFGMGMTLAPGDFARVLSRPGIVGLGVALQYLVMPLAAWVIGTAMGLPGALLAGLVLVGASPGGTASNVICYLARGDVALSITLTAVATVLAVILTPALTWLYVGETVPVPVAAMLWDVARVVLLPVALGVGLNRLAGRRLDPVKEVFPAVSVLAIVVIIAVVVALNAGQLAGLAVAAAVAVMLHNLLGLAAGFWVPRLLGFDVRTCRTLAIEVGMQNSGLGVALAVKHFSAAAALPGALFSVWHNLSGAVLAAHWGRRDQAG